MKIIRIGLDLAKNVFQVHGVDLQGKTGLRRQLRRNQMLDFPEAVALPGRHGSLC